MRVVPRTLAGQAVAMQVAVVVVIVFGGSALAVLDSRIDEERAARQQVTAVAVSLADSPSVAAALTLPNPTALLQPVTEEVRATTGIAFITIMAPDGTRYTHTNPGLIGQTYISGRASPRCVARSTPRRGRDRSDPRSAPSHRSADRTDR